MTEWRGFWRPMPGSITADGAIVGTYNRGERVPLIQSGVVAVDRKRLAAAKRFGWQRLDRINGLDYVVVGRPAPSYRCGDA